MLAKYLFVLPFCLPLVLAASSGTCPTAGQTVTITDQILLDANCTTLVESCTEGFGDFATVDECANATTIAQGMNQAFKAFGINSYGQAAGAIAQMFQESGCFRENRNHFQPQYGCATGCVFSEPGKGTYSLWPNESLALYAMTEGVITQSDLTTLDVEAILTLLNGPLNYYAYGPHVWFLKNAQLNNPQCDMSFTTELDNGQLTGYQTCLQGSEDGQQYMDKLMSGMATQACAEVPETVAMGYVAGSDGKMLTPLHGDIVTVSRPASLLSYTATTQPPFATVIPYTGSGADAPAATGTGAATTPAAATDTGAATVPAAAATDTGAPAAAAATTTTAKAKAAATSPAAKAPAATTDASPEADTDDSSSDETAALDDTEDSDDATADAPVATASKSSGSHRASSTDLIAGADNAVVPFFLAFAIVALATAIHA